jgi:hypothetical protein
MGSIATVIRPTPLDARIAALAARQHGVLSRAQLRDLRLGDEAIRQRMARGRLHRIHRGVYSVGHPVLTGEARWLAAVLACGPGAVLSHRSAAALWNIQPSASTLIDVTVPARCGRRRPGIRVHRSRRLGEDEVTRRQGIPVTSVARTLLDIQAGPKEIEAAEQRRLFDLTSLQAAVQGNPGRRKVEVDGEPAFTRSGLEHAFLALCEGLPQPRVNAWVGAYEVDFLWPEHRLIVETDGRETHGTRAAFERDRARDAQLTARGFRVVRFTYKQVVYDPTGVATLLGELLATRRRLLRDPASGRGRAAPRR